MTNPTQPSRKTATAAKAQRDDTSSPAPAAASNASTTNPTSEDDLPTLKELILKLDAFLAENAALRKRNDELYERYIESNVRNDELAKRIETLERLLEDKTTTSAPISAPPPLPPAPDTAPKERYDALILSDSILRHVGGDCPPKTTAPPPEPRKGEWYLQDVPYVAPKPYAPLLVKKCIAPGARAAKLYNLALGLAKDFTFDHIIVHCGTNNVMYDHPDDVTEEITDLLAELRKLFNCRITFSPILPRVTKEERKDDGSELSPDTVELLQTIENINSKVYHFCQRRYFGTALCRAFIMNNRNPLPRKHLLAQDGCHLNRRGIVSMEHSIYDAINSFAGLK